MNFPFIAVSGFSLFTATSCALPAEKENFNYSTRRLHFWDADNSGLRYVTKCTLGNCFNIVLEEKFSSSFNFSFMIARNFSLHKFSSYPLFYTEKLRYTITFFRFLVACDRRFGRKKFLFFELFFSQKFSLFCFEIWGKDGRISSVKNQL